MPNTTSNLGLFQPLVNNPTDQDLWGGYISTNFGNLDSFLLTTLNWTASSQTSTITVTIPTAGSTTTGSARTLYTCNATGGAFAANLPAVATAAGLTVAFKKTDSSANAITVTGNSSDNIDGANTFSLGAQYQYLVIQCDGSKWNIISQTPPSVSFNNVALTGTPTAPTATYGTNTTQVATTAFVQAATYTKGNTITMNPYVEGTRISGAHGLSSQPNAFIGYFQCLTAELGYSIGDRVLISSTAQQNTGSEFSFWADATNAGWSNANTSLPVFVPKNSNSQTTITAANWELIMIPLLYN